MKNIKKRMKKMETKRKYGMGCTKCGSNLKSVFIYNDKRPIKLPEHLYCEHCERFVKITQQVTK